MAIASEPFYGCLCLETASARPLPANDARQSANCSLPEIHFNIWEHPEGSKAFLDIGLMLDIDDPAEKIELFLPWQVQQSQVEDLAGRILASNGISAVFNESWASSTANNRAGAYVTRNDGTIFSVVPCILPKVVQRSHPAGVWYSIEFDVVEIRRVALSAGALGTVSSLKDMYVRIRVKDVPANFYRVGIDQGDALGGGALNRTEIIDFRMNVRRGAPSAFETSVSGRFLEFSKVHLFLMKARDHDLIFEDKNFKACRSLEDEEFWATYILPHAATQNQIEKSRERVKNSLGYQWRRSSNSATAPVVEFGILARFKSFYLPKKAIMIFSLLAVLLGLAGNGIYDLLKYWILSIF